jgi:hypothetical protein
MKSVNKMLVENIHEQVKPIVVKLFKFINEIKKTVDTEEKLGDEIKNLLKYFNIPEKYYFYILKLYLLNYREDGNYSGLTKDNFIDPRYSKLDRTANSKSRLYTSTQLPFKGSNLRGFWKKDNKGEEYYVVQSYNWYPMFIYKYGNWHININAPKYSVSTSKQYSQSLPQQIFDSEGMIYNLTYEEMRKLEYGIGYEDIMNSKLEKLDNEANEFIGKKHKLSGNSPTEIPFWVKYTIDSIDKKDNKRIINVTINDVLKRSNITILPTPENYLKGELGDITPEYVEEFLEYVLSVNTFSRYIGYNKKRGEKDDRIEFNFKHLRK